jgi:hypothetical protein
MSHAKQTAAPKEPELRLARRDHELRARFEHVRALNSAWATLAPFEISADAQHIVEAGRAIAAELRQLAGQPLERRDPAALPKIDKLLDATGQELLALAVQVPVAQLRANLPGRLASDRRGLLDLLDLMLGAELEGRDGAAGRICALDYLITLLCTGGNETDGSVAEDPVGLTPRLHALCERAGQEDDPELATIEAEFYAAASIGEDDTRDEDQLRTLRRRKRELGVGFFAPRVLRAIVAYNAALSRGIRRGGHDSRDWGSLADGSQPPESEASVFESEALPRLAEALRRRAVGEAPSPTAIDRVAWCLDLASLDETARDALLASSTGLPDDLTGTAMLVGLLCRSSIVLDDELPGIGIAPGRLGSEWAPELDEALTREVNAGITGDGYEEARRLSELRSTFRSLIQGGHREQRRLGRAPAPDRFDHVEREAKQLAGEALVTEGPRGRGGLPEWRSPRTWLWIGRIGCAVAAVGLVALVLVQTLVDSEFDRLSGAELDRMSPYLAQGKRSDEGRGRAFVGTIEADWVELPAPDRESTAAELVDALRAEGVREIMIYDEERRLRIQALGESPARVLPDPAR